jgi:hypothetical protein
MFASEKIHLQFYDFPSSPPPPPGPPSSGAPFAKLSFRKGGNVQDFLRKLEKALADKAWERPATEAEATTSLRNASQSSGEEGGLRHFDLQRQQLILFYLALTRKGLESGGCSSARSARRRRRNKI